MPTAKKEKQLTAVEQLKEMKTKGIEHEMPGTGRLIRLRTLDAETLLRKAPDKIPDILTPMIVKSVYADLQDREVKEFINHQRSSITDALAMADAINFVVKEAIVDNTKLEELTTSEKKWIFRLAMGPAELLVTFRDEEEGDVGTVDEGKDVS